MDLLMIILAVVLAACFLAIFIVPDYILYQRRVNSIPTATLSHIQLSSEEDAQAVKEIIQDKESDKEDEYGRFCTAAKIRSTCKSGKEDFGNLGVFPIDTFAFFDTGYLILKDQIPIKDIWISTGLGVDILQSFFFRVFGVSWNSYLIHSSLMNMFACLFFCLKE